MTTLEHEQKPADLLYFFVTLMRLVEMSNQATVELIRDTWDDQQVNLRLRTRQDQLGKEKAQGICGNT